MSRDPDLLPSLRTLGDRLGDAAEREIAAGRAPNGRRRRRRRVLRRALVTGGVVGLVVAGGVTATEVFTGDGPPVRDEPRETAQPGVLTDSAAADPGGGLPWALRIFVDDRGRECLQLGRLRGGTLGTVENGRFRPFQGSPTGPCRDTGSDPLSFVVEDRAQPERTMVYGLSRGRGPVRIRVEGRRARVDPGALGAYVVVFEGLLDRSDVSVTAEVDGRTVTRTTGG